MPDKLLTVLRLAWLQNTFPEDHKKLVCPHNRPQWTRKRMSFEDILPLLSGQWGDRLWRQWKHKARRNHMVSCICKIINVTSIYFINRENYVQILYPLTTWRWNHDNASTVTSYWATNPQKSGVTHMKGLEKYGRERIGGGRAKMLPNILCYWQLQSFLETFIRCLKALQLL